MDLLARVILIKQKSKIYLLASGITNQTGSSLIMKSLSFFKPTELWAGEPLNIGSDIKPLYSTALS